MPFLSSGKAGHRPPAPLDSSRPGHAKQKQVKSRFRQCFDHDGGHRNFQTRSKREWLVTLVEETKVPVNAQSLVLKIDPAAGPRQLGQPRRASSRPTSSAVTTPRLSAISTAISRALPSRCGAWSAATAMPSAFRRLLSARSNTKSVCIMSKALVGSSDGFRYHNAHFCCLGREPIEEIAELLFV